jgi:phosphoglycolate phosphatase
MINIHSDHLSTIIWDWNGTLLNDLKFCIDCMNKLLVKRGLAELTAEKYHEIFTFPVINYYTLLGFDFTREEFKIPAEEFIVHYNQGLPLQPLHDHAEEILDYFYTRGISQYIVSAMQHESLSQSVLQQGISTYFNKIYGIADNLAHGKSSLIRQMIQQENIAPGNSLLIGDTLHDAEVAKENGIRCILIANGHQSRERLIVSGFPVIDSLEELQQFITQNY